MNRIASLALAATLLIAATSTAADGPAGNYRLTVDLGAGQSLTFLLNFESKNGQGAGKFLGASVDLPPATAVENVNVVGDRLQFAIKLGDQVTTFDGKLPAAKDKIRGSYSLGGQIFLTALEPSQLAKFDRFDLLKEMVAQAETGPQLYDSVLDLLRQAGAQKAKPEEVRAWAEKAIKAAEAYGVRWQLVVALRVTQALVDQPEYAAVALAQAQRAERLLDPAEGAAAQLPVLELLAQLLRRANKAEDAKEVLARIAKLEERDYQEYAKAFPVKAEAFAGRKGKSDRAVLVELFTGTECPPCVAADLAFDALGKVYKPTELVRLQYHLHVPGPDPLTNPASEARAKYYGSKIEGTPTAFFNGQPGGEGGGQARAAEAKLKQYRGVNDPLLETPSFAKLQVTAKRDGDTVTVGVRVTDLARRGEKVRLRLALAEETVRYQGGNGVRYHHCVVRGFIGSADGFALTQVNSEHQASMNLEELRAALVAYLDKFLKDNEGVSFADRPLGLRNLRVVAFVQDDASQEVLQAARAEVK
jgi:hypothetical protein